MHNRFVVQWQHPENAGKVTDEIVYAVTYNIEDNGDITFIDVVENDHDDHGPPTFIPVRSFATGVWIKVALAGTFGKENNESRSAS